MFNDIQFEYIFPDLPELTDEERAKVEEILAKHQADFEAELLGLSWGNTTPSNYPPKKLSSKEAIFRIHCA